MLPLAVSQGGGGRQHQWGVQQAPVASVLLCLLCGLPIAEGNRMFTISQPPSVAKMSDGNEIERGVTILFQPYFFNKMEVTFKT